MAYLDIWDIIRDRGFWDGVGSGEEVNGRLGFTRPLGGLAGGAEELLRGPLGGRAPTEAGRQREQGGGDWGGQDEFGCSHCGFRKRSAPRPPPDSQAQVSHPFGFPHDHYSPPISRQFL